MPSKNCWNIHWRAHLASTANVGQASRLPGRAKRGPGGANAAPFGAAGQAGRLPYVPGALSGVVALPSCALFWWRGAALILSVIAALAVLSSRSSAAPAAVPYREDRILIIPKAGHEAELDRAHALEGVRIYRKLTGLGNIHILQLPKGADPRALVERYRRGGHVETADLDYNTWRPAASPNDPHFLDGLQWHLHNTGQSFGTPDADIDAPEAWDIQNMATNIIVAFTDTGLRITHEDLAPNLWTNPGESGGGKETNNIDDDLNGFIDDVHGINAINMTGDLTDESFIGPHGTHVAGIAGAVGNNGLGVCGIAWKSQIMPLKFISGSMGSSSGLMMCLDYARQHGAKVINCSAVSAETTATFSNAFWTLRQAGIVVCAAAGNFATDNDVTPYYPASFKLDNLLAVTSTDHNDQRWPSGNYGQTSVHLGAPGVDIYSTSATADNAYGFNIGTSMSAPMVTGAAALLRARFPSETAQQIVARILGSVDPLPSLAGKCVTGGRLNLRKALDVATMPLFDFTNAPFAWVPTNGMTPMTFATSDSVNGPFALPFALPFYGKFYTQIWVSANGSLGVTNTGLDLSVNANIPQTSAPNAIYPYWDNLNPTLAGGVWCGAAGAAPNRKWIVSWVDVPHMNNAPTLFSFQAILHESGHVGFQYLQVETGSGTLVKARSATVGIEDPSGLFASRYTVNGVPNLLTNTQALVFTPQVVNHPAPGLQAQPGPMPGQIELRIAGEPAQPGAILYSADLVGWSMIYSNRLPASGLATFTEANSASQRFYRAVSGPFAP
ncbi:MAG TPA: S8 family peptidase [Verrucomicrobiae bacterium]|nr:S8 family peptidase [Verrucomicrobiae bacterium]